MSLRESGSIQTLIGHEHPDWPTNKARYQFPEIIIPDISLSVSKEHDGTLRFHLNGPFGKTYIFCEKCPTPMGPKSIKPNFISVSLTWGDNEVKLYLNGSNVATVS